MHFKNIEINNFRGFDHLKIEDFGQINLFVGKNNSGKTSVLESLFLLSNIKNPLLVSRIENFRGNSTIDVKVIFHKLKFTNKPSFTTTLTEENKDYEVAVRIEPFANKEILNETNSFQNDNPINDIRFVARFDKNLESRRILAGSFIHSHASEVGVFNSIAEIIKAKQENKVCSFLSKIDNRIKSFTIIDKTIYFDFEGFDERLPSHILGDGIRKILLVLSTIFSKKNPIVLVDEIENGLHYTAHKALWKGIIEACKNTNAQIFATTHSLESLKCLNEVLQESEYADFQEKVRCYDLVKTKLKGFQAYKYNYEGFSHALQMETEIR